MWLEDSFGSGCRVKMAASFWNNIRGRHGSGGMAAAFFLDKHLALGPKLPLR